LELTNKRLLESLRLIDGRYIRRAALLLLHQDPERFVPGAFGKMGMFAGDENLIYQHEVHGPMISMPDRVMETLYLNYFKGIVSYRGLQRVETFPVPLSVCREAVTNAVCHRDYATGVPIRIKVFPDRVVIHNEGSLPENWTIRALMASGRSEPRNPMIADAFFLAGLIESWGLGLGDIVAACREAGQRKPPFAFKHGRDFSVTFRSRFVITTTIAMRKPRHGAAGEGHRAGRVAELKSPAIIKRAPANTRLAEAGRVFRKIKVMFRPPRRRIRPLGRLRGAAVERVRPRPPR
jgi:ATP-dependent DNA helicase RecG